MANGDKAIAAGMDVVSDVDDRRMGYDEINKTRDYIAEQGSHWIDLDGVPSQQHVVAQYGIGKIVGSGTGNMSELVTFPVPFASTPIVIPAGAGFRNPAGPFNPKGLAHTGGPQVTHSNVTENGFTVNFFISTSFNSALDWYYSWTAIGVLA